MTYYYSLKLHLIDPGPGLGFLCKQTNIKGADKLIGKMCLIKYHCIHPHSNDV